MKLPNTHGIVQVVEKHWALFIASHFSNDVATRTVLMTFLSWYTIQGSGSHGCIYNYAEIITSSAY